MVVEDALIKRIGEAAPRLHRRNDRWPNFFNPCTPSDVAIVARGLVNAIRISRRLDSHIADLLLSVASPLEMAIKVGTGKLSLKQPVLNLLSTYLPATRTTLLPIALD